MLQIGTVCLDLDAMRLCCCSILLYADPQILDFYRDTFFFSLLIISLINQRASSNIGAESSDCAIFRRVAKTS